MKRICIAILPEVHSDGDVFQRVNSLIGMSYHSYPLRQVIRNVNLLSQELLMIVYLTMLGFTFPVEQSYNPKLDRMKTWSRELMLRIVKCHGPQSRFEYQFLTPIEHSVARFL